MIIDAHTHCYPDDIAPRAIENVTKLGLIEAFLDGQVKSLQKSMKKAGIDYAINLPLALSPEHERGVNSYAAKLNNSAEETGVFSLGSIHPNCTHPLERLSWIKSLGLTGIKMHPEYQLFSPTDPICFPIYEACEALGLVILFHAGDDLGFEGKPRSTPTQFIQIAKQFPNLQLVLAHLGGFEYQDTPIKLYNECPNIMFDVAYLCSCCEAKQLEKSIKYYGTDRVMYGSDSPWVCQTMHLNAFKRLNFTEDQFAHMLYQNAIRIFKLKTKKGVVHE